ncbi:MAG TPA: glycosyltransferase family 9 protein [Verrucomicrobiae bacterium]
MADPALVIFQKQLGDTVLLEPALAKLAAATGEKVHLWCKPSLAPVVELMENARVRERRQSFDSIWVYEKGSKATFRAFLTSARKKHLRMRSAASVRWHHRVVFDDIQFKPKVNCYFAQWYWDVTEVGGGSFRQPRLRRPPIDWRPKLALPERFLLLNATASEERKCWRADAWRNVLGALRKEIRLPIIFTGSGPEWAKQHVETLRASVYGLDAFARTNLKEFMFLISRAELVLTVDGACSHLAQAFARPCATIFSATNDIKTSSWYYPNERSFTLVEKPGMNLASTSDEVVREALKLFHSHARSAGQPA